MPDKSQLRQMSAHIRTPIIPLSGRSHSTRSYTELKTRCFCPLPLLCSQCPAFTLASSGCFLLDLLRLFRSGLGSGLDSIQGSLDRDADGAGWFPEGEAETLLVGLVAAIAHNWGWLRLVLDQAGGPCSTCLGHPKRVKTGTFTDSMNAGDLQRRLAPPPSVPRSPSGYHPLQACLPYRRNRRLKNLGSAHCR